MKKLIVIVAVLALTLALGTTTFAASPSASRTFVDANNDGICDNYGTYPNFVDADNDGICDNCNDLHTRNNANRSNGCIGACASGSGHGYGRNHR